MLSSEEEGASKRAAYPTKDNEHMYLVETCWECRPRRISLYNISKPCNVVHAYTGEIYKKSIGWALCSGPGGSLLTCSLQGEISQYRWVPGQEEQKLSEVHCLKVIGRRRVRGMCYVAQQDSVILSDDGVKQVLSVKLGSSDIHPASSAGAVPIVEPNWVVGGKRVKLNGRELEPEGVTCDDFDRVYVADNSRVVILDAIDGSFIQEILGEGWGDICNIGWSNSASQLAVLKARSCDSEYEIQCYNLRESCQ